MEGTEACVILSFHCSFPLFHPTQSLCSVFRSLFPNRISKHLTSPSKPHPNLETVHSLLSACLLLHLFSFSLVLFRLRHVTQQSVQKCGLFNARGQINMGGWIKTPGPHSSRPSMGTPLWLLHGAQPPCCVGCVCVCFIVVRVNLVQSWQQTDPSPVCTPSLFQKVRALALISPLAYGVFSNLNSCLHRGVLGVHRRRYLKSGNVSKFS